jgi:hypothetical protein
MSPDNAAPQPTALVPITGKRRRRMWLMVLLGAIILICGMAIGAGGAILRIRQRMHDIHGHPERMPAELAKRIRGELRLTDEQAARVEAILVERLNAMEKIRNETFDRVHTEIEGIHADVTAILAAPQAAEWNERYEDILMPRKRPPFMSKHSPPPGPKEPPGKP